MSASISQFEFVKIISTLEIYYIYSKNASIKWSTKLVIRNHHCLSHLLNHMPQLLHQILTDAQVKGKSRILVCTVDGLAHIQVDIRAVFYEYLGHHGASIGLIQLLEKFFGYSLIFHISAKS